MFKYNKFFIILLGIFFHKNSYNYFKNISNPSTAIVFIEGNPKRNSGGNVFKINLDFTKMRYSLPIFSSYWTIEYFKIALYLFIAILICILLAVLAYFFSLSQSKDNQKLSPYECGYDPYDNATRVPFDVHFYVVGILFLIFDIEIALLFPWVLCLSTITLYGFVTMLIFLTILIWGFIYEWKQAALTWPA